MAEEQFTSRRARREAERLAAEQAFEARETPEQPSESSSNGRADLLNPPPAPAEEAESQTSAPTAEPSTAETEPAEPASRVDAEHVEPGPSAPVDPQRAPLPHFDSRTARGNYLREHGLSQQGDVSTGAIPVIAGPEEAPAEDSDDATVPENESYDTAGFGGSPDEVAARDFESPVTAAPAPRPTALDDDPQDALSRPIESLDAEVSPSPADDTPPPKSQTHTASEPAQSPEQTGARSSSTPAQPPADDDGPNDERAPKTRSRRMPIVQPPSSSGVRVVTAASAQIPAVDNPEATTDTGTDESSTRPDSATTRPDTGTGEVRTGQGAQTVTGADSTTSDWPAAAADSADESASSSDDAARALAANPETRPMETVPEAWALPNPDYEDEETENPPGSRIRASAVTGHDGRILVGEEPSKVPYVVLGVAALFAVALIVIALVMLL